MSQSSHNPHQAQGKNGISCEWKRQQSQEASLGIQSTLYPFCNYTWEGVKPEVYKQEPGNFANIVRNIIVGAKGESCRFEVRYFEIAQEGGFSSLEKHNHEHVVICIRGQGQVRMGKKVHDLNLLDIAYISPDTPHQLINRGKEPFGFFCIVDRERDHPQELSLESIT